MKEELKTKPNLGKRIGATIFDQIVLWTLLYFFITTFGIKTSDGGYSVKGILSFAPFAFWFMLIFFPEYYYGATVGHRIFNLKVVSINNNNLSVLQVLKRRICDLVEIYTFLGLIAFVLVY